MTNLSTTIDAFGDLKADNRAMHESKLAGHERLHWPS